MNDSDKLRFAIAISTGMLVGGIMTIILLALDMHPVSVVLGIALGAGALYALMAPRQLDDDEL